MDSATSTVLALNRILDSLDRMAFIHGWAVITFVAALAVCLGWKLWKG